MDGRVRVLWIVAVVIAAAFGAACSGSTDWSERNATPTTHTARKPKATTPPKKPRKPAPIATASENRTIVLNAQLSLADLSAYTALSSPAFATGSHDDGTEDCLGLAPADRVRTPTDDLTGTFGTLDGSHVVTNGIALYDTEAVAQRQLAIMQQPNAAACQWQSVRNQGLQVRAQGPSAIGAPLAAGLVSFRATVADARTGISYLTDIVFARRGRAVVMYGALSTHGEFPVAESNLYLGLVLNRLKLQGI